MSLNISIPGRGELALNHLVLDLNGTLALDGKPLPGVREAIGEVAKLLNCHLLTADTFGTASGLFGQAVQLALIRPGDEIGQKLAYLESLGARSCAALGNGANDEAMLKAAAVGVAVLSREGAAGAALAAADLVVSDPVDGLGLFLNPSRLVATLRR